MAAAADVLRTVEPACNRSKCKSVGRRLSNSRPARRGVNTIRRGERKKENFPILQCARRSAGDELPNVAY